MIVVDIYYYHGGVFMGSGYSFVCKKCHHEYSVNLGIGMMFPTVYRACLSDIKEGKYGEEWKELASSEEYVAVDASRCLYICDSCGNWDLTYSLSLYKPKNPESIPDKQFGIKTVREWGYVPYVTLRELNSNYIFLKSYVHKCDKCGNRMHKADTERLSSLACPKCGTENEVNGIIRWD